MEKSLKSHYMLGFLIGYKKYGSKESVNEIINQRSKAEAKFNKALNIAP